MKFKDANKFKVGDRVRVLDNCEFHEEYAGKIITIDEITLENGNGKYMYNYCDGGIRYFSDDELESTSIANTKTARKLYPEAKVNKDGDLEL